MYLHTYMHLMHLFKIIIFWEKQYDSFLIKLPNVAQGSNNIR